MRVLVSGSLGLESSAVCRFFVLHRFGWILHRFDGLWISSLTRIFEFFKIKIII